MDEEAHSLAILMAVYNEEALLPRALQSLLNVGILPRQVYVFDGAWRGGKGGSHTFADSKGPSTDATMQIAHKWGARCLTVREPWPSQEAKRTRMFEVAMQDRSDITHLFVMDADETLDGLFAKLPNTHANVMVRCIGPNDLPGIRGEWPLGDYRADFKPELRLFRRADNLECLSPGYYWGNGRVIKPYSDAQGTSALPILEGVTMDHHGNDRDDERKLAKIAYYRAEHPQRERWERAIVGRLR